MIKNIGVNSTFYDEYVNERSTKMSHKQTDAEQGNLVNWPLWSGTRCLFVAENGITEWAMASNFATYIAILTMN